MLPPRRPPASRVGRLVALSLAALPALASTAAEVPREYVCYRAAGPVQIDGRLDEMSWSAAPWTTTFVDIEGASGPEPRHATRAKMLWDDSYFYVAAEMDEPHLWATLTERDSVIYYDNDFEVFLDPDGDTHAYYELEVNALGTVWDLMLLKPYRDGGPAIDSWDIQGLELGVQLRGTLNDPSDLDSGWTVEIAMPWSVLEEAARHAGPPSAGETWRVNFSRVQWRLDHTEGRYAKVLDPATGKPLAENNWVWSPQHAINMHRPEHWGFVQFSDAAASADAAERFVADPDDAVRRALRELYYRQRRLREQRGTYASSIAELEPADIAIDGLRFEPRLESSAAGWVISASGFSDNTLYIRDDGLTWSEE